MTTAPTPIATYRIQLTPTFGFADTIALLDHLVALGVSHVYLSPVAEAVPGSTHGYDVVDHRTVRNEFGGRDGLEALLDAAGRHGLGVLIDHVPNHVSAARADLNEPWWEVLRDGRDSHAARWFDVDWELTGGKVIVPKLGAPLSEIVAAGDIAIGSGARGPELRYGPLRFPLAAGTEAMPLDAALAAQHYELTWWRDERRNVRRFFTIDDLVAVRVEDPAVAAIVDSIPAGLAEHEAFAGVRVDHVDGLADPLGYLATLRERIGSDRWLLVEKILAVDEELPAAWPVDGTTGYEHIRRSEHAVLHPSAEPAFDRLWGDLSGDDRSFEQIESMSRREALAGGLAPDMDRLVRLVRDHDDSMGDPYGAVAELTLGLHRYRTYLPDDESSIEQLDQAVQRATVARPDLADDVRALRELVLSTPDVARRWQQLTSPVMAKGAEDRAFYRYLRLAALCEVGGAPGTFALDRDDFHREQRRAQSGWPSGLLAGTTHDTKRSEGVRARALALAECAEDWATAVREWMAAHPEPLQRLDPVTVLLALETAVTAWPLEADRLHAYLVKATREAEEHTSWTAPDDEYESALRGLAELLGDELADVPVPPAGPLGAVVQRILRPGWSNSLALLTMRLTLPGVPDVYQGTAAFTYSLVDPDNRVEPDWDERRRLLAEAARLDGPRSWSGDDVEASKTVVLSRILAARRRRPEPFGPEGTYEPVATAGPAADRLLAFARGTGAGAQFVVLVALRSMDAVWRGTTLDLPDGTWRDLLTDDAPNVVGGIDVDVAHWLDACPVVVLERI